jgi:micrococcal nuclease
VATIARRVFAFVAVMLAFASFGAIAAPAESVAPADIQVIDGGTIRARGATVTLLGYDTPRRGVRELCQTEIRIRELAKLRLRDTVARGNLSLQIVPCPCGKLTRGTFLCNRGRACGVLRSGDVNVGDALIKENLARSFVCGETRCPRRKLGRWCE